MDADRFECWFCGRAIEPADTDAVAITLESFRRWYSGTADGPSQMICAHFACAKDRLEGRTMGLDRDLFNEEA